MINAIKKFFDSHLASDLPADAGERQLRVAAVALLFEVGRSDFSMDPAERIKIADIVREQFELPAAESDALLGLAEREVSEATSLHGFTSLINQHWPLERRVALVQFMWNVVYADGRMDDHELHLMRKIQRLLYIPHEQFVAARLRAKSSESEQG